MSGPAPRRADVWRYLPLPLLAALVGVLTAAACAQPVFIDRWYSGLLRLSETQANATRVVLLTVSSRSIKDGQCGEMVTRALTNAGAQAGLMSGVVGPLCPPETNLPGIDPEVIPPIEALPPTLVDDASSLPTGFDVDAFTPLLEALGMAKSRWLRVYSLDAVPVVSIESLYSKQVDPSALAGKVVAIALADDEPERRDRRLASRLAAGLQSPPLTPPKHWLLIAIAALASALTALATSRWRANQRWRMGTYFGLGLSLTLLTPACLAWNVLPPTPAVVLASVACWGCLELPRRIVAMKADRSVERLLQKASRLLQVRAPAYVDEAAFWQSLARRAAQAHPADDVLVAELPPFSWRLKVWPNGELDESVIRERRRDIRRTPYANQQGVPVSSVVDDYLVMNGVPTVMVPVAYRGEIEGYLLLIGQSAADYFADNPLVARALADDLAALIRNRRIVLQQEQAQLRPGGLSTTSMGSGSELMLSGARTALAELRLMNRLVQYAPVGLCYADPFGDVRILGKAWLRWIPQLSIDSPTTAAGGTLAQGQLALRELLETLTQQVGQQAPLLSNIGEDGFSLDIPVRRNDAPDVKALKLQVFALPKTDDEDVGGFMASLTELSSASDSIAPRASIAPQQGDPLVVFSLARLMQRLLSTIPGEARSKLRLQTPRDTAHVVAHRGELRDAMQSFLVSAAKQASKGSGPLVALKELDRTVEVRIMDLKLGAPLAALERVILAPSAPPAGLGPLGVLVRAVENSHGYVELVTENSWGLELKLFFVRARPRIENPEAVLEGLRRQNRPLRL